MLRRNTPLLVSAARMRLAAQTIDQSSDDGDGSSCP
jgi:hypothetical protein